MNNKQVVWRVQKQWYLISLRMEWCLLSFLIVWLSPSQSPLVQVIEPTLLIEALIRKTDVIFRRQGSAHALTACFSLYKRSPQFSVTWLQLLSVRDNVGFALFLCKPLQVLSNPILTSSRYISGGFFHDGSMWTNWISSRNGPDDCLGVSAAILSIFEWP